MIIFFIAVVNEQLDPHYWHREGFCTQGPAPPRSGPACIADATTTLPSGLAWRLQITSAQGGSFREERRRGGGLWRGPAGRYHGRAGSGRGWWVQAGRTRAGIGRRGCGLLVGTAHPPSTTGRRDGADAHARASSSGPSPGRGVVCSARRSTRNRPRAAPLATVRCGPSGSRTGRPRTRSVTGETSRSCCIRRRGWPPPGEGVLPGDRVRAHAFAPAGRLEVGELADRVPVPARTPTEPRSV